MVREPSSSPSWAADAVPSPAVLRRVAVQAAAARVPALRAAFRPGPSGTTPDASPALKTTHHDLVTVHDRSTESALVAALTAAVPGSRVLGEETGVHGQHGHRLRWIVDPIDGTSNFSHGFALFSVSVAAEVDGEVVAGAIVDPVAGQVFSSDDAGAYLAEVEVAAPAGEPEDRSDGAAAANVTVVGERPLAQVGRPAPAPALGEHGLNLVTSYPAGEALAVEGAAALERFGQLVRTFATVRRTVSGALELAYTAAGWADAALYVDTKPWDVAAGVHLLRAAGGTWIGYAAPSAGGAAMLGAPAPLPDGPALRRPAAPLERAAHTAPFALALAPGRQAPTAAAVLQDVLAARRVTEA